MKKLLLIVTTFVVCLCNTYNVYGVDFQSAVIAERVVDEKSELVREKVVEFTLIQDAINEKGEAVKIKSGSFTMSRPTQFDDRIAKLEVELSKWKAIRAEYEKE